MRTYLEYKDEKSHKFWEIEVTNKSHSVCYGKVGSNGRRTIKEFKTEKKAQEDAERLIISKKKKGYKESENTTSESLEEKSEIKNLEINKYKIDLKCFEEKLKNWGFGYPEWAGCRLIQYETVKVKHRFVDPE